MYATKIELQIGLGILIFLLIVFIVLAVYGGIETVGSVKDRNKYREENRKWLIEGTSCPAGYHRVSNTETFDENTKLTKFMCEKDDYAEPDTKYKMLLSGSVLTGAFLGGIAAYVSAYWDRITGDVDTGAIYNTYLRMVNEIDQDYVRLSHLYKIYGKELNENIVKANGALTEQEIKDKAKNLKEKIREQSKKLTHYAIDNRIVPHATQNINYTKN